MDNVRKQKDGRQKPWTKKELEAGLKFFFETNKRYPTASEVDLCEYLPSARTIERSHGGLVQLRKELKLDTEPDYRAGKHSSDRAHLINDRAHKVEQKVYTYLIERFGKQFVHREYFFTDDKRTRADFFIYDNGTGFCVDVFYPNSLRNLSGCLNLKLNKYSKEYMDQLQYSVIFLQMNKDLVQEQLNKLIKGKKRPLLKNQYLMDWISFQQFCTSRTKLSILQTS
jgi:CRISPR/Cas system-associated endoribonuclease Cas2